MVLTDDLVNTKIIKVWLTQNKSVMMTIPKEIARKYELDRTSHLIIKDTKQGISLRKLEINENA